MTFPTTESHIDAAERELGVRLPREYRLRLLARNGGELSTAGGDWQVFPVFDATNPKATGRSTGHIVEENRGAQAKAGFPRGALAIASNRAGDFLVLLSEDTRLGPQVFVWNHETHKCKPSALRYEN